MTDEERIHALVEGPLCTLRAIQYGSCDGCGDRRYCVECDGENPEEVIDKKAAGHKDGCPVAAALSDLEELRCVSLILLETLKNALKVRCDNGTG